MGLIKAPRYDLVNNVLQTKWVLTKWVSISSTEEKGKIIAEFPYKEENETQAEVKYQELQAYSLGNSFLTFLNNFNTTN